jgi:hypothetical protein
MHLSPAAIEGAIRLLEMRGLDQSLPTALKRNGNESDQREETGAAVRLNGTLTAQAEGKKLTSGPIALQYMAGTVRFRRVQIRRL